MTRSQIMTNIDRYNHWILDLEYTISWPHLFIVSEAHNVKFHNSTDNATSPHNIANRLSSNLLQH